MEFENLFSLARERLFADRYCTGLTAAYLSDLPYEAEKGFQIEFSTKFVTLLTPWEESVELVHADELSYEKALQSALRHFPAHEKTILLLQEEDDPATIEGCHWLYWFIRLAEGSYEVNEALKAHLHEKTLERIKLLIGEDQKQLADEGRYVPGSAKERAAIRKLQERELEEKEENLFPKFTKIFSEFEKKAKDYYREDKKSGEIIILWPAGITTMSRIEKAGRQGVSRVKKTMRIDRRGAEDQQIMDVLTRTYDALVALYGIFDDEALKKKLLEDFDLDGETPSREELNKRIFEIIETDLSGVSARLQAIGSEENAGGYCVRNACYFAECMAKVVSYIGRDTGSSAEGYIREWNAEAYNRQALKKAKEMGDYDLIKEMTARPQLAEFLRKGGREVDHESVEGFLEAYGLDARQFGKSLSDKDRRELLSRASRALSDLADVLGVDDKRVGIKGSLSLALAARGRGGKGAASAHYEPDQKIINLTKRKGTDGSLAHEFGHALDYGSGGQSFYDFVDGLDDLDIKEAFSKLNKAIFLSDKETFLAERKEELVYYTAEHERVKGIYFEGKKTATALVQPLDEEIEKMKLQLLLCRDEPDVDNRNEMLSELQENILELSRERSRVYSGEMVKHEPYRLYANSLNKFVCEIRLVVRHVDGGSSLEQIAKRAKIVGLMPVSLLVKESDEELRYPSQMLWEAAKIGLNDTKKGYWTSPKEMFARSFETYIAGSLDSAERQNSFLCHDVCLKDPRISPYPKKAQRKVVSDAMEEFVFVLKKKDYL